MTTIATLAVKIIADAAGFLTTMDDAEKKTNTWSKSVSTKLKSVGQDMTQFGQGMTTFVTLPILAAGASAIKMASSLEETKNKVKVVFGDMSNDMLAWSKNSDLAMGMSQNMALSSAAGFGNLFKMIGMGAQPTADMSQRLVQLAADLASFNDADPSEVLQSLQSGLIGQAEPMRKFGVLLSEGAVALKAVQMGLVETNVDMVKVNGLMLDAEKAQLNYNSAVKKYGEDSLQARQAAQTQIEIQQKIDEAMLGTTEAMTEAEKVQARYALILEQTATAQGDFANTSDSAANLARQLAGQYENAAGALGAKLLPYVIQAMQWLSELITQFQALTPEQQKWVLILLGAAAAAGPLIMVLGSLVTAIGAIVGVVGMITVPMVTVVAVIAALIAIAGLLYVAWTNNWGGIQEKTAAALAFIQGVIDGGMQFISDLTSGKLGAVSEIWNRIWSSITVWFDTTVSNIMLIAAAFQAAFNGDWRRFGELLRQAWDNGWKAMGVIIQNAGANIWTVIKALGANILNFFATVDWLQLGKDIVLGIVKGLLGAGPMMISAMRNIAAAALEAAKGFLGIRSPSKVFEMQVGWQMAAGTALGWERGLEALITPTLGNLSPTAAGANSGMVNVGGMRGNTGSVSVTLSSNPIISMGDRYELESTFKPALRDMLREMGVEVK